MLYKKELFEKGTYGWAKGVYTITRIERTDDFNWLEQKHFVADGGGDENPDWYMGYEMQKVEGADRNPRVDEKKASQREAQLQKKVAKEKQQRQMAREGLDEAAASMTRGRRKKRGA